MNPLTFFYVLLKSAFLSTGGFGNVPILHHDFVRSGLLRQENFAEALAIGQISPGPNGLWVVCLGYFYGGLPDAALALLAITIPPFAILLIRKLYLRHQHNRGVEGFMMGLELAVAAIFLSVMIDFLADANRTVLTAVLAVGAFGLSMWGRVPVAVVILSAAITGFLLS